MSPEHRDRTVAFIVARLSSSRLPAKQLRAIGGKPILLWTLEHLRRCRELDEIVLATVAEAENEPLRVFCAEHDFPCFWYEGDVDHVTTRLCRAAETYGAEICLLISGDCPLVHGPAVDLLVRALRGAPEAARVAIRPHQPGHHQLLEGVHVARRDAWLLADELSDRPELKEHQFPLLYQREDLFSALSVDLPPELCGPHQRLSVDTPADLEFMQRVHDELQARGEAYDLPGALRLLAERPELREINAHVHQRGLVADVRKVLCVVDAGGEYGLGHLTRTKELAQQITERLSWPVTFVVDDERAERILSDAGFRTLRGALARPARCDAASEADATMTSAYDLLLVDVSCRRPLPAGWRRDLAGDRPVVLLDRADAAAAEADLVVFPGVTGQPVDGLAGRPDGPRVLHGLEYTILRREVRAQMQAAPPKDIDLLVYLHDPAQRDAVRDYTRNAGIKAEVLDAPCDNFPNLLARSRVFLSGYGQAFYEAAALGAYAVVWPVSPVHEADAQAFYRAAGVPGTILRDSETLAAVLGPFLASPPLANPALMDGTTQIVAAIEHIC